MCALKGRVMKYSKVQRNLDMHQLGCSISGSQYCGELVKQRLTLLPDCRWPLPTMERCSRIGLSRKRETDVKNNWRYVASAEGSRK